MSLRRHILQVVALVTAVALVFGAFAGTAGAKKLNKSQKAKIRAELRKSVKKNPGVVKRRAFLRKAALVNFKLPVTIRLRNPCNTPPNPTLPPGAATCAVQGTALNQLSTPTAKVNLGPSLGTRQIALGGGLAAVVEFNDTYDGGALGNVNIKILPGNKSLTSSSVPLLWNNDITDPTTRSDANFAASAGLGALGLKQGCGDWTSTVGGGPGFASGNAPFGAPATYKSLFYNDTQNHSGFGTNAGVPGYPVYTTGGGASGAFLPIYPDGDPTDLKTGAVTGNNDYIGTNPDPFPGASPGMAPTNSGNPSAPTPYGGWPGNAGNTVLRTNALSLSVATGGTEVNMSTGTGDPSGLTTAQGSDNVTLGYSGGQANLFGNIPGKNVGIDVTVNLATKINSIVRIMDQDVFNSPSLVDGGDWPAGIFNCRQIWTGAVQNYIPGVRLTGSLRIAPAITKDGKVRIAKATVSSDSSNPDRVALSACLFPAKSYNAYTPGNSDTSTSKIPSGGQVFAAGNYYGLFPTYGGIPKVATTQSSPGIPDMTGASSVLPLSATERYPTTTDNAPSTTPCGTDAVGNNGLADIIRLSGLTGTVSGLPTPTDPAYTGYNVTGNGAQATVAGDITVNPIDVDVLLGDVSVGT